ncbi:hypothetical protein GCM10009827_086050 [Dactylosporangium maewongense]|uniref:Uncharacterized protein n=1 Tax=Dactylosporangium maewongense TaxID=634393 RepID=A0ABP4MXS1_9ACTN
MISMCFEVPGPASPGSVTWERVRGRDAASLTDTDLRYRLFLVHVEFTVDGVEVIWKGRWITLVDLCLGLTGVVSQVKAGAPSAFGYTEHEEVIHVVPEGGRVVLTSSMKSWRVDADAGELVAACTRFVDTAYARLVAEHPDLTRNAVMRRFAPGWN